MAGKGYIGTFLVAMALGGTAQSQAVLPAEFPPTSFEGNQFVDSNGCAFVRAGVGGAVNWIPRFNRSRQQLCNFQPTFPDTQVVAALPPIDPDLIIEITPPAAAEATAPAPIPAPTRTRGVAAPIQTVASIPANRAPAAAPAPAPAPTVANSPRVVAAPTPAPQPRITFAEACDGRFGVQPGFISSVSGDPIDCGPAPTVATAPAPEAAPVPQRAPVPRMTLAQICAENAETGQRFVDANTGQPIVCAPVAPVAIAAAPVQPQAPVAPVAAPAPSAPSTVAAAVSSCEGIPNMRGDGRYVVRCGPQTQKPYTEVSSDLVTRSRVSTSSVPLLGGEVPIPASNPSISTRAAAPTPPAGYERVWTDGRINPQRGIVAATSRVSTRTVAPAAPVAATGHRYVQIGSFGDPENAARLIGRLAGMGLPVASGQSGGLKIVAAGPFSDAASLGRALQAVRGMGFADAYTRN